MFDHFEWSGENSILQRDEASQALAERLRSQSERFPGHVKVIVAHSHGGNVAMRALHRLGDTREMIRVITLATPFVEVFYTPGDEWDDLSSRILGVALTTPLVVALFLLGEATAAILVIALAGFALIGRDSTVGSVCFVAVLAALVPLAVPDMAPVTMIALLLVAAIGWLTRIHRGAAAVGRWLIGPFAARTQPGLDMDASVRRLTQAASLHAMRSRLPAVLVLRGVDDEAALVLAAGALGARISRILVAILTRLGRVMLWTVVTLSIPVIVVIAIGVVDLSLSRWFNTTLPQVFMFASRHSIFVSLAVDFVTLTFLLACLPVALTLTVLVCCACKSVHGRELLHGSVVLDVVSNSAPDCLGNVDAITLPHGRHTRLGLRHCLYDHPDVARVMAAWLSASRNGTSAKQGCVEG